MARAKRGVKARRRRNKVLKLAKGFQYDRRTKYRSTADTVKRALHNVYKGRKLLKRNLRRLWIVRIGAASRLMGSSYSKFMGQLKKNNVTINRKMLADIAATDFKSFEAIFKSVQ